MVKQHKLKINCSLVHNRQTCKLKEAMLQDWPLILSWPPSAQFPFFFLVLILAWWERAQSSVLSGSVRGLSPARLLCPWDIPGKATGVGCHFLPHEIFSSEESNVHLWRLLPWRWILYHWAPWEALFWFLLLLLLSCSVVSESLWPHGLQHARLPCPSPCLILEGIPYNNTL